jgi:hypothetical protein
MILLDHVRKRDLPPELKCRQVMLDRTSPPQPRPVTQLMPVCPRRCSPHLACAQPACGTRQTSRPCSCGWTSTWTLTAPTKCLRWGASSAARGLLSGRTSADALLTPGCSWAADPGGVCIRHLCRADQAAHCREGMPFGLWPHAARLHEAVPRLLQHACVQVSAAVSERTKTAAAAASQQVCGRGVRWCICSPGVSSQEPTLRRTCAGDRAGRQVQGFGAGRLGHQGEAYLTNIIMGRFG